MRHEAPPGLEALEWSIILCGTNACIVCKGYGKIPVSLVDLPSGTKIATKMPRGAIAYGTSDGKVWMSCMVDECSKWADITKFIKERVDEVVTCPGGHRTELKV